MAMTKKAKKIALIVVASVLAVVILAAGGFCLWWFVFNKVEPTEVDINNLSVYTEDDFTVGNRVYSGDGTSNEFDLNAFFGEGERSYGLKNSGGIAAVDGSALTVNGTGDCELKLSDRSKAYQLTVVDAVNVTTIADFKKAVETETPVVVQKDLKFTAETGGLTLKADVYGNGHKVVAKAGEGGYYDIAFNVKKQNLTIRDLQIVGREVPPEEMKGFKIEAFDHYGILVNVDGGNSVNLKNCVLENANRLLFLSNGDATVEGCFFQNAADACISVEAVPAGGSNLTLKNNVIRNATVAGVLLWGYTAGVTEFNKVNIEGFLDIYNWKSSKKIELIPRAQGPVNYGANGVIQSTLNGGEYDDYFYRYVEAMYLHLGIIVMATGALDRNDSKVFDNGVELTSATEQSAGIGYANRVLPIPSFAQDLALHMCNVYGYLQDPLFKPGATPADNIFLELRGGRAA